jgi:2-keto-3-deoxy-L-rhamnonate aldolase RhmA
MRLTDENMEFKAKLKKGDTCVGSWVSFSDPCVAECMALAGFDFLIMDMEHSPNDADWVQLVCFALKGTRCAPIVRLPWNDMVVVKRVLDVGAAGVLLPWIRSVKDVEYGVAACKYPPQGVRGIGPRRPAHYGRIEAEYLRSANDQTIVIVQIEHIDAVECIEDIVRVEGLDAVFVGPNDLSASMGLVGQTKHPRVVEAISRVLATTKTAGMPAGIATSDNAEDNLARLKAGFQFLGVASDFSFLSRAADRFVKDVKAGLA